MQAWSTPRRWVAILAQAVGVAPLVAQGPGTPLPLEVEGITVTPHVRPATMRFAQELGDERGARVQLFVRYRARGDSQLLELRRVDFDGKSPEQLLAEGVWAWHDTPSAWPADERTVPPGALMVWTFNTATWNPARAGPPQLPTGIPLAATVRTNQIPISLEPARVWISALTFLGAEGAVRPDALVAHVANESGQPVRWSGCRVHLPESASTRRYCFVEQHYEFAPIHRLKARTGGAVTLLPADGFIPPGEKGFLRIATGPLPLTYAIVELRLLDGQGREFSLWAHQRIKRETFDISGGWVGEAGGKSSPLLREPFLKTLRGLHVNTAHIGLTPGYTDQTGPHALYSRYPLKFFGASDRALFDTDAMLPRVHAVEFLGEPQYRGGGGYKTPQEVQAALAPYATGRLPTSLTLSDPSTWRLYAGLADYPHFDAYRVSAPMADAWRRYDRWGEPRIGWGAPLETIGDMCRSLREMSRPAPIAAWTQGPHHDCEVYDGRTRTSPTPEELRLQAYHALASRITSLYWFNLSLRSLVKFRDTLPELARVGREARLLDSFYLAGDAYRHQRVSRDDRPDWDLASIVSPEGALLFALDLDYAPDPANKVFAFQPPREARFDFDLPAYLRPAAEVFLITADGLADVSSQSTPTGVSITDRPRVVGLYAVSATPGLRQRLEQRLQMLIGAEQALGFDPGRNDADFAALKGLLEE
jgi:hypothetical protein